MGITLESQSAVYIVSPFHGQGASFRSGYLGEGSGLKGVAAIFVGRSVSANDVSV